ncbi:MAG TPA: hypothetical protein VL095_01245, partial [Flavisolibacter sp.]|nr:hypothetical protein [Flavisolibacter sp.]
SILDLKPKLIEKLQQLVKQGSGGLYNLFIHELKPDILKSTVSISKASLVPDTAALKQLEQSKQLPDAIFRIKTDSIWIDGLGIKDILSKDVIDVKTIHIHRPTIDVYSKKRSSANAGDSKTLYQRLTDQMKHIGIGKVIIQNGTLVHHNLEKNKNTKFNDIAINLTNIVIDSTTQFDKKRFLFAKDAELTLKNYAVPTSNNLYTFKVGVISIKATQQLLVARNISLKPHYNKQEFQNHIQTQRERFDISIPSVEFQTTDWWSLINNETLIATSAQINKADVRVYLDRRKPSGGTDMKSFPHQLIMKLPLKIAINKIKVNDLDLVYEEFSKLSNQAGKLYVDNLQGTISNFTNIPAVIKRNGVMKVSATGLFMHAAPTELTLSFDLANYNTGAFSASLKSQKGFNGPIVNPIAEPLGAFRIKRGELKELTASISGDNYKASGEVVMLYNDLHITPLKQDPQNPGELKKKSVTSFIANTFVLKDENPSKDGQVRKEKAEFTRKSGTFFNTIWKTTFIGILKTIGAPEKLAYE